MDCSRAEELFEPYLLGALESRERQLMDSHLDTCHQCNLKLREDGETAAKLALGVPQLQVPPRVKQRLFASIDEDIRLHTLARPQPILTGFWATLSGTLALHGGKAVTAALVVGIVFGGIWFNARLNEVSEDNSRLGDRLNEQLQAVAQTDGHAADVMEMVKDQRFVTYETLSMYATPGTSVNMLWGTRLSSRARGMMVVSHMRNKAVLLVLNLPPLPRDKAYQVWLIKESQRYGSVLFTVDSTGSGQAVIFPVTPLSEFDGIGITIEPIEGSDLPTGSSVLEGDL